jgi:hypothetical protein
VKNAFDIMLLWQFAKGAWIDRFVEGRIAERARFFRCAKTIGLARISVLAVFSSGLPIFFGADGGEDRFGFIASVLRCPHCFRFAGDFGNANLLASRWT